MRRTDLCSINFLGYTFLDRIDLFVENMDLVGYAICCKNAKGTDAKFALAALAEIVNGRIRQAIELAVMCVALNFLSERRPGIPQTKYESVIIAFGRPFGRGHGAFRLRPSGFGGQAGAFAHPTKILRNRQLENQKSFSSRSM